MTHRKFIFITRFCEAKIKITWSFSSRKVQVERFKNSSDYSYTLDESNMLKCSNTIQTLVTNEAIKNYAPATITSTIKEYAKKELSLGNSIKYLKQKEVANIKYRIQGPMNTYLVDNKKLEIDITKTLSYLRS
ncbi:23302_t:CDS:2 [Gigaspora margarita]|uniref:23302_t:CDS:1 n=1 Tax=Gigaspora margarita TaxID=4874 RepID=A0ABN7UKG5_GIGMA|nr:23302_t:CDS:2 [Gigaspora margarita]